jgi:hypothetical protein
MQVPRIYLDTSVFSGCFESQFERESRRLVELVIVSPQGIAEATESAP